MGPMRRPLANRMPDLLGRPRTVGPVKPPLSAIAACEMLLVMRDGQQHAFGPRNEVLQMATRKSEKVVPLNRSEVNVSSNA